MKPISPEEVTTVKQEAMPEEVFEAFNELIAEKYSHGRASIFQKEIVYLLVLKGLDRQEIFDRGWLDVEDSYRAAGWVVEFDKPGYNETYEPYFVFRKKSPKRLRAFMSP